jgi:hypothetical protein
MNRNTYELHAAEDLAAMGIPEAEAAKFVSGQWNGTGYNTEFLQDGWSRHRSADCCGCPNAGQEMCCGGAV